MVNDADLRLIFADEPSRQAWEAFAAQGACPPGTTGWWKVWGACVRDIRAGDLFLMHNEAEGDDEVTLVNGTYVPKNYPLTRGITIADGSRWQVGALTPIVLLRQGTHNTLGAFCR